MTQQDRAHGKPTMVMAQIKATSHQASAITSPPRLTQRMLSRNLNMHPLSRNATQTLVTLCEQCLTKRPWLRILESSVAVTLARRQHFSSEAADVLLPEQPQHLSVSLNFVILSITRVFSAQEIRDPIQVFLNLWMVF